MVSTIRIAGVQFDINPGEVEENLGRMVEFIAGAAAHKADLVVFPEVATTDYYIDDFEPLADTLPGAQSDQLARAAAEHKIMVAAGLIECVPRGIYNSTVLFDREGGITGIYRKTHLSVADRGGTIAKESDVFLPGNDLPVFETELGVIGMMICKDGDYPEVPRTMTVRGAELILWMTNRHGVNKIYAQHYAKTNRSAIISINRAEGHVEGGGSLILDWVSRTLAEAGNPEEMLLTDLDMEALRKARTQCWNVNRVRRPELYAPISEVEGQA